MLIDIVLLLVFGGPLFGKFVLAGLVKVEIRI